MATRIAPGSSFLRADDNRRSRIVAAAAALALVVLSWACSELLPHHTGDLGVSYTSTAEGLAISSVAAGRSGATAGLRAGDVVRASGLATRTSFVNSIAGVPLPLRVDRNGRTIALSVTPALQAPSLYDRLLYLFALIYAVVALLIAFRAKMNPATTAIIAFMLGIAVNAALNGAAAIFDDPYAIALSLVLAQLAVVAILYGQFAFPMLFPQRRGRFRTVLIAVGVSATAAYAISYEIYHVGRVFGLSVPPESWFAIAFAVVVIAAIIDSVRCSDRAVRPQAFWAGVGLFVPLVFFATLAICKIVGWSTGWYSSFWIAPYTAGLVVSYAVLRHRLGGLELFISRAATFSIVSLLLVSAFLLLEWSTAMILERSIGGRFGATEQTLLAALIALFVGLSARSVHDVASRRLNRLFYAKRYHALEVLHRFSLEIDSAVDGASLTPLALTILERSVDAQYVGIYRGSPDDGYTLQESCGSSLPAYLLPDDESVLRLRRWHEPFVNGEPTQWFRGAYLCPMSVRGILRGLIVCGPKRDHGVYLPDERETLAALAHRLGTALEWLTTSRPERHASGAASVSGVRRS